MDGKFKPDQQLTELLHEGVWVLDRDGLTSFVNQSLAKMLGYKVSAMIGRHIFDFMDQAESEKTKILLDRRKKGVREQHESVLVHQSGRKVDVLIEAGPIYDDQGNYSGAIAGVVDITERKRADKALRESEARYRAILSAFPDLMFFYDRSGTYVDYHAADQSLLAAEPEYFLNKSIGEVLPAPVADQYLRSCERAFNTKEVQTIEYSLEALGGLKYFEARIAPMDDNRLIAIVRDITGRRQAEQALQLEQHEKNIVLENLVEQVAFLDPEMRVIWGNPQAFARLNLNAEQARGRKCFELYHNRTEPCSDCPIISVFKTGRAASGVHRSKDGLYWKVTGSPVFDREGKMIGVLDTALDVTELKQAEEALQFQLKFEKMVARIATFFVGLPVDCLSEGIDRAIKLAGEFFRVDRSYLFQFSAGGEKMSLTHEWCAAGIEPQLEKLQNIMVDRLPWWAEQIRTGNHAYIADIDSLPPEAEAEKKEFRSQGIKSLLCVPVFADSGLFGFFGFDAVKEKKAWPEDHIYLLKIIAELISGALNKNRAEQRILHMSFHDQLTDLYNRAYLDEEMKRLNSSRQLPVSLIMADLNGLKLINDTYGHNTGDAVLKKAAAVLTGACREDDIIARWGGDEFVILLPQTRAEEAWAICDRINASSRNLFVKEVPISMALGVAVREEESEDLSETLKKAEDNMYRQKLTESRSVKNTVLKTLLKTLQEKSYETEIHTRRMLKVAQVIGAKLNLPETELRRLELLITLHDIGKINIVEEILTKQGALNEKEWDLIKRHPETGFRIARATEDFAHVADDILAHHEHWDGSGYPRGLRGRDIPILARITAIADAYEVMSNGRPYKQAMTGSEIVNEFKVCSGSHFDPELVKIFLNYLLENPAE